MIEVIFHFFAAGMPWLVGAAASLTVYALRSPRYQLSDVFLCLASGGYLGLLSLSAIIWGLDRIGLPPLSTLLDQVLVLASLLSMLWCAYSWRGELSVKRFPAPLPPLSLVIAVWLAVPAYSMALLPAVGWDSIDHWARVANLFLEHASEEPTAHFTYGNKHHPLTLQLLAAWSGGLSEEQHASVFLFGPWLYFKLSGLLAVASITWSTTRSTPVMLISVAVLAGLPLLENHSVGAGYAEIPLISGILLSTTLLALALEKKQVLLAVGGVIFALSLCFLKNSGAIYAIAILTSAILVLGMKYFPLSTLAALAMIVASIMLAREFSLVLDWGNGERLGYDSYTQRIYIAGKSIGFRSTSFIDALLTVLNAVVMNLSFSIFSAIFVIAWCLSHNSNISFHFVRLVISALAVIMLIGQYTTYGYSVSMAGADTGLSRFFLPGACLATLLLPFSARVAWADARPLENRANS